MLSLPGMLGLEGDLIVDVSARRLILSLQGNHRRFHPHFSGTWRSRPLPARSRGQLGPVAGSREPTRATRSRVGFIRSNLSILRVPHPVIILSRRCPR